MTISYSGLIEWAVKTSAALLILNELRGMALAVPVIYAMYEAGGTLTAIWLGISSLGGIILSVLIPLIAAKKLKRLQHLRRQKVAGGASQMPA